MIVYRIPGGAMEVDLGEFFQQGGRVQIRRMLRQLRDSRPDDGQAQEVKGFLEGLIQTAGKKGERKRYQGILGDVEKILGGWADVREAD